MKVWMTGALVFLLVGAMALAQEPVPVGQEFQVNTYTTDGQRYAAVAMDTEGRFVVVWKSYGSYGTDTSNDSIQGQRYDANGAFVGSQFQINTYTTSSQTFLEVAADPQGNFVVVWYGGSYGTDTHFGSIQGQRYDSSGTPAGGEFQVNSYTTHIQSRPAVAADAQGDFVVTWQSYGSYGTDTDRHSIQGQRYDSSGAPLGGQFQVNTYTTDRQRRAAVAADTEGRFVVVWTSDGSYGTDTGSESIQAQRYDASGTPVGGQFQVNTYTTGYQGEPAAAADSLGNVVVVWESDGSFGTDSSSYSIQGQRYDSSGTPVGGQFQVNTYTTSTQWSAAVAVEPQGDFVVVWDGPGSYGTDTSLNSVQGQRYDASGTPVGGQFQVNTYTTDLQMKPAVDAGAEGTFVVVWRSDGSFGTDSSSYSIQGQRFSTAIFTDGFESGDTSAWSSAVP